MAAYYNEIDPKAAAWLRELIRAGAIAPGDVDERSIVDVRPADLRGYRQCHFFAGIGIWSYALRQAGWSDEREVWTGSCPCQPFSVAGKGAGHEDERHLWPAFFGLIRESRPLVVFGEQVADGDGYAWIDDVGDDLEGIAYAVGSVCPTSCGFGAPDERQRMYWVADACGERRQQECCRSPRDEAADGRQQNCDHKPSGDGAAHRLEHAVRAGPQRFERSADLELHGRPGPLRSTAATSLFSGLVDAGDKRHERGAGVGREAQRRVEHAGDACGSGPLNGFWRTADWLFCTDGKWRPVESGTFPLAYGAPARMVRLRGYGNGINAEVATAFIEAYLDVRAAA